MTTSNQLSSSRIALTFAGSVLGAGYLSGQELLQFFGAFGLQGIAGLIISMLLLALLSAMVMLLASRTGITELDRIIILWDVPILRHSAALLEILFLLASVIVMYAGGGTLFHQLFGLPVWMGCLLMCILVTIVAMYGIDGTIRFFSLLVPPAVVITVLFGMIAMLRFGPLSLPEASSDNPLLGNWLVSAVSFAAYNFFSIIGLLTPVGARTGSRHSICRGAILGAGILLTVAASIIGAMFACSDAASGSLPMLTIAAKLHPLLQYPYGIVLFSGMFGSALYGLVAVIAFFEAKSAALKKGKVRVLILLAAACYPSSLLGFGNLISILYPLIGYCSIIFIACMIVHFFKIRKCHK